MNEEEGKLAHVDALRGVAILMVIMVHVGLRVPHMNTVLKSITDFGQFGVQLFFVASAFTLCVSFKRRESEPKRLQAFYLRRFFRIAPLYYLAIPIYFAVGLLRDCIKGSTENIEQYTAIGVASNFLFVHGFVPEGNNTIVPGGWSIGTEMAFYALFPFAFLAFRRFNLLTPARALLVVLAVFLSNLVAQFLIGTEGIYLVANSSFRYFNLLNQAPVFAVGYLGYCMFIADRGPLNLPTATVLAAALCFASATAWNSEILLKYAILPTLVAFAFLSLIEIFRKFPRQNRVLCRIGRISFSMYIFHFLFTLTVVPVLAAKAVQWMSSSLVFAISFFITTVLTFAIASFTERLIEERGIRFGRNLILRLQSRAGDETPLVRL